VRNVSWALVEVDNRCAVQVHLDPVGSATKDAAGLTHYIAVDIVGACTGHDEVVVQEALGLRGRTSKVGWEEVWDDHCLLDIRTQRVVLQILLVVVSKTSCRVRGG